MHKPLSVMRPSTFLVCLVGLPLVLAVIPPSSGGSDGRKMAEGCVMRDEERRDSWDQVFMLNAYECESRGFCWAVHEIPGVPWCYHKEGEGVVDPEECAAAENSRRECATPGKPINEKACASLGCCWKSGGAGLPWCFHPGAPGATPKPKAQKPAEPEQPREPLPPATTPRFIRPTPPPQGWQLNEGLATSGSSHSEL